ncbi:MAG: putative membrane protein YeaQ/YmgE (transglycosylase-associated protein family) [Nitriliruptoraceae bacterium]|jgi:uncharacterized membrane protein YeaQ/YmgE (transglycosylase-associated protein family)
MTPQQRLETEMSFDEKQTWLYLVSAIAIPAMYARWLLRELASTPAADVAYVPSLLAAIGAAVLVAIVGAIITATAKPSEANVSDERDRAVHRRGEVAGAYALSGGALGAMVLAFVEADQLWIGNALYAAFVLQAITTAAVKLFAYRRGF